MQVISLYEDVRDTINKEENGYLSYAMFNRLLHRSELDLLRFLTGDLVDAKDFPMPYQKQKNKDYLAPFITPFNAVNDFDLPKDYFTYERLFKLGTKQIDCETNEVIEEESCSINIGIYNQDVINNRCSSYIKSIRPSVNKPIAKIVNNRIEIFPKNIGSVRLEYIRYPKFGEIKTVHDNTYNDEIADEATSINLEWSEWAREYFINSIANKFATHIRESALKQHVKADIPRG